MNNPIGPTAEVAIDTDQGTWMSVDVSPDGKEVVFDLLGDLYVIPIAGGEARALTSGMAWDMQPRYSPDGRWIAFTSDRGGGDNVWVLPRQGGGLVPAAELLMVGYGARQHIRKNALQHLHQEITITRRNGSFTLEESLAKLVKDGQVEWRDAHARAAHPEEFEKLAGARP